jgi:SAM-dependent methyltransferase
MRQYQIAKKFGNFLYSKMQQHNKLRRGYLKFARFLSTHGIDPPLARNGKKLKKRWAEQGTDNSDVRPEIYANFDDSIEKLFQDVLPTLDHDSSILEIGCNAGRSLDYLFHKGFHNLTGIEIGSKAVELFAQTFADTYQKSRIIVGDVVKEIQKLEADSFDLVFTHSVLVSISARDNAIFREICRICRGYILILENEGSWTAFPRNFQKMFKKNGFMMVSYRWMVWNEDKTALRFPRAITDQSIFKNNIIRLFAPVVKNAKIL